LHEREYTNASVGLSVQGQHAGTRFRSDRRLAASSAQVWDQNTAGIPDQAEPFEFFGGAIY
jgi:hypothetical protein